MRFEIILHGLAEKMNLEIKTNNPQDERVINVINSIISNFRFEFTQIRKLDIDKTYLYFDVI